jgi:hypothetical protein
MPRPGIVECEGRAVADVGPDRISEDRRDHCPTAWFGAASGEDNQLALVREGPVDAACRRVEPRRAVGVASVSKCPHRDFHDGVDDLS